jgi:hypothetical protein
MSEPNKYPAWIEPHSGHKLLRNSSGAFEHSTGLEFHQDRVSKKVTVLATDERDNQLALAPPRRPPLLEVIEDGSGTAPVSFDDLVARLAHELEQHAHKLRKLAEEISEMGSRDAYREWLENRILKLEARLRDAQPAYDRILKLANARP